MEYSHIKVKQFGTGHPKDVQKYLNKQLQKGYQLISIVYAETSDMYVLYVTMGLPKSSTDHITL